MSYRERHAIPDLGVGVGFRIPHYARILDEHPPSKVLANWRRFASDFEEREEDFDWGDA